MRNHFLLVGMIACCMLSFLTASAYNFAVDGIYYKKTSSSTVGVTYREYNSYSGSVVVPDSVNYNGVSYKVTSIESSAFYGCTGLTTIEIPNSVTTIGTYAFKGCTGLTTIEIPNSVTTIDTYAFEGCNLASLTIGTGVTYIRDGGLSCKKVIWLTNTPPEGHDNYEGTVNYVSNSNFKFPSSSTYVYDNLSSMFEVDGVVYVPVSPSERTCDIIDCVYGPESEQITLSDNVSYKGVEMNVINIRPYSFYENNYVKKVTANISNEIPSYCFEYCSNLMDVKLSNKGVVGDYAFARCPNLTNIELSNTGFIAKYAFAYSASNEKCSLIIGPEVENIGSYAFCHCSSLSEVNLSNTGDINDYAFQGCASLTLLSIPLSVKSIGYSAFENCSSLSKLDLQNNGSIGNYAFSGCSSLSSLSIAASVESIGKYAFESNRSLASIDLQNKGSIGKYAFSGCSSLASLTIQPSITSIGDYAFNDCNSLADVTIKDGMADNVLSLGSNGSNPLFASCPLDEVYIGRKLSYDSGSKYGYSPFYRNTSLRSVEIADVETTIYDNEFYGCTNLQSVKTGDGVTSFGKYAFSGCAGIEEFVSGKSVETIGEEAFSDCTGLKQFYSYAAVPPTCGNQALDDINKWECTLFVPESSIESYKAASQWKDFFFIVNSESLGIDEEQGAMEVYDLNGVRRGNSLVGLSPGLYIVRQNGKTKKCMVK